jgi:acyl carrier protein
VLGLDRVGIYDNFFDLGGHSLALVKLRAQIESRLGRRVSLPELFTYPTIATLSRHLFDQAAQPDIFAEVRRRSALQQEAFLRRRRLPLEQRTKKQMGAD